MKPSKILLPKASRTCIFNWIKMSNGNKGKSTTRTNAPPIAAIRIRWPCEMVVPSERCESRVIQTLHRKGEWGRGRDLPQERIEQIKQACDRNHMTLYQALSLRRTMLRSFPNGMAKVNQSSQMGSLRGQRDVASLFEEAVRSFLATASPHKYFLTESEINAEMKAGHLERGPTPDILFLHPVEINGRAVRWIDAKLYYASATYARNRQIPNGKLVGIAQRYNTHYGGEGAFVFGQGFCSKLKDIVHGALLLDPSPLDMTVVEAYQTNQET